MAIGKTPPVSGGEKSDFATVFCTPFSNPGLDANACRFAILCERRQHEHELMPLYALLGRHEVDIRSTDRG